MRKKFLSAFLLGLLTLGATSTMTSCKDYDDDISNLQGQIDKLDKDLAGKLADLKSSYDQQLSALGTQISSAQAQLQAAIDTKADKTTVAALTDRVVNLETAKAAIEARLVVIEADIQSLKDTKADKAEVNAKVLEIEGNIASLTGDVTDLKETIKTLATKGELQDAIDAYKQADTTMEATLRQAIADAVKELSEGQVAKNATDIATLLAASAQLPTQLDALSAADKAVNARVDSLNTVLGGNYSTVLTDLNEAKTAIANLKTAVGQDAVSLVEKVNTNATDIKGLKSTFEDGTRKLNDAINTKISETEGKISAEVNTLAIWVTKRLTSIVFRPTNYINGIETINFTSLTFKDWGKAIDVCPDDAKEEKIRDGKKFTDVEYFLNPTGTNLESIESFSFVESNATNLKTRAAEGVVSIVGEPTFADGVLKMTLKKNNDTVKINNTEAGFTIVALKATLAENVKAADEKGKEIAVYSDWARLSETAATPCLHNKKCSYDNGAPKETVGNDAKGADLYPHLLGFSDIYPNANVSNYKFKNFTENDRPAWTIKTPYTKTVDLADYAMVCDQDGNKIDAEKCGLTFAYNLMIYNCGDTKTENWAKREGSVVSPAFPEFVENTEKEAKLEDCVGKTPVAQIKLMYGDKVVDVKYVMIEWTKEAREIETTAVQSDNVEFTCDNHYDVWLTPATVANIAEIVGKKANEELADTLDFTGEDKGAYTAAKNIKLVNAADTTESLGYVSIFYKNDATHRNFGIQARFDLSELVAFKDVYDAPHKKTIDAIMIIPDQDGREWINVPMEVNVVFDKEKAMGYDKYAKLSNYWKDNNTSVVASPTIINGVNYNKDDGYADAQMRFCMLDAYSKDGAAPTKVADLVKNAAGSDFNFDLEKIQELYGDMETETAKWNVADAGANKGAYLKLGEEIVAVKYLNGVFALWDGFSGELGNNNTAGLKVTATTMAILASKKGLPVVLNAEMCEKKVDVDNILIKFEIPLEVKAGAEAKQSIDDQRDVKEQEFSFNYDEVLFVKEAWGKVDARREVYGPTILAKEKKGEDITTYVDLAKWYMVDVALPTEDDITVDGKKLAKWTNSKGEALYTITVEAVPYKGKTPRGFKGTFKYNGTNALTQDVVVTLPITVTTKWGEKVIVNAQLTITNHDSSAKKH